MISQTEEIVTDNKRPKRVETLLSLFI